MTDLIGGHLAHCRAAGLSPLTIRDRGEVLARLDRDLPQGLEPANTVELRTWLGREGWSQETLCTYYTHIRSYYRWVVRNGHLTFDPTDLLDRPKRPKGLPRPITEENLALALDRAAPRWQLPFRLGAFAGLRCCEIATITRNQITRSEIRVVGKGRRARRIPTHRLVWELVADVPPDPPGRPTPLVRMTRGPVNPNSLSRLGSAHFTEIGLPEETLHKLRHRFATQMLLPRRLGGAGADVRAVQVLMGHESLATTEIYLQVTDEQTRLAIEGLPVPPTARTPW